jgi:hypothetical protein
MVRFFMVRFLLTMDLEFIDQGNLKVYMNQGEAIAQGGRLLSRMHSPVQKNDPQRRTIRNSLTLTTYTRFRRRLYNGRDEERPSGRLILSRC